jgi:predicted DNA-binding transcriptional regulator YafY
MPVNKSALVRYHVIDSCLTNTLKKFPAQEEIIEKIETAVGTTLSSSMFNKDIAGMKSMYNAPIHYDRYRKGYCYTDADFSIKKFPLLPEEIEALDFSTALLNQLKGTAMFVQFENAINKVIEGYRISKIIGRSEKQIIQVEEPLKTEANKWLEIILKAILHGTQLAIVYKGFQRSEKIHPFSPYLLKEYRNRWYAVGYSEKAKDILVFALDRIADITVTKAPCRTASDFDPAAFFKYSLGITQVNNVQPDKVVLSFTPNQAAYILSQPLHASQKIILENAYEVQIEMELYLTQELTMMILSYGAEVKVLGPEKLRKEISECIGRMGKMYAG